MASSGHIPPSGAVIAPSNIPESRTSASGLDGVGPHAASAAHKAKYGVLLIEPSGV
jgi:hypothetical protein